MLKIRVIGTKNEIAWFQNLVRNHLQIEVLDKVHAACNRNKINESDAAKSAYL